MFKIFTLKINGIEKKSLMQYKNIAITSISKILYAGISFLIVPLLINQVTTYQYGLFTTIVTATTWLSLVDGGLSNGIKNKLTMALANKNFLEAQKITSTAYFTLFGFVAIFSIILLIISNFLNWNLLFNANANNATTVNFLFVFGGICFLVKLLVDLITVVLQCHQQTGFASIIQLFIQVLVYFFILGVKYFYDDKNIKLYAIGYFIIPILVLLATNFILFSKKFNYIKPSYKFCDFKKQKNLFKLSGQFFIIQTAAIIIFTTDNLIISRFFNYIEVAKYNIAFRYFNIITFVHVIVLTPYWTAITDAYTKNDIIWIKKSVRQLQIIWFIIILLALTMLAGAPFAYKIWIHPNFAIAPILNIGMFLFIIISCWNNIYATFLNAVGKIKIQFYASIFVGIINIPFCIILIKYTTLGPSAVIFATSGCLMFGSFWAPIQYYKLINKKAEGIWNK